MKFKLFAFALFTVMFISCGPVMFETPQPVDAAKLKSFPAHLTGTYMSGSGDTLIVTKKTFNYGNEHSLFPLNGNLKDEECIFKKADDYYILNLKFDLYWTILIINETTTGISIHYVTIEESEIETLIPAIQAITDVEEMNDEEGGISFLLAPTKQEFDKLVRSDIFNETVEFEKIK
jgi:hypothetical protein